MPSLRLPSGGSVSPHGEPGSQGFCALRGRAPCVVGTRCEKRESWQFWKWRSLTLVLGRMENHSPQQGSGFLEALRMIRSKYRHPKFYRVAEVYNQIMVKDSWNWSKDVSYLILKLAPGCDEKLTQTKRHYEKLICLLMQIPSPILHKWPPSHIFLEECSCKHTYPYIF